MRITSVSHAATRTKREQEVKGQPRPFSDGGAMRPGSTRTAVIRQADGAPQARGRSRGPGVTPGSYPIPGLGSTSPTNVVATGKRLHPSSEAARSGCCPRPPRTGTGLARRPVLASSAARRCAGGSSGLAPDLCSSGVAAPRTLTEGAGGFLLSVSLGHLGIGDTPLGPQPACLDARTSALSMSNC